MKILYLELHKYKRIALNNIDVFKIKMTAPLQLILGTNGSGKSSVMRQLTPLPPDQKEFKKDGYKKIIIEHHNSTYELISSFTHGQKHTFIKDGIKLNDEGTVTVQKDLVKEHFRITPDIQNLISGKDPFDSMSPNKRKEWFINLCDTNYDYAISVYNKFREKLRDTSGALKLAKRRMSIESEKLIKNDEQKRITDEVKELGELLNILLDKRMPLEDDLDILNINQNDKDVELMSYAKSLEELLSKLSEETLSVKDIDTLLQNIELNLYSLGTSINKTTELFNVNKRKIDVMKRAEQNTIVTLTKELSDMKLVINNITNNLLNGLLANPNYSIETFKNIKMNLIDAVSLLPPNIDRKYSQENLIKAGERLSILKLDKSNVDKALNTSSTKITHMEKHRDNPDLTCPKCNNKFSLDYNAAIYEAERKYRDNALDKIVALNKEISKIEEYITACNEYSINMRHVLQILNNTPELNNYWGIIKDVNTLYDEPESIVYKLGLFETDILKQIDLFKLKATYSEKNDLLNSLKEVGTDDLNTLVEANESLSKEIELLSSNQIKLINDKKDLSLRKQVLISKDNLLVKINKVIKEKKSIFKIELESIRRIHLNTLITSLQKMLAAKVEAVDSIKTHIHLIEDINSQITILSDQEKALKELVNVLSPSDGLIAEGLTGFINSFVEQMNFFIKKVWSYPLVIHPCGFDSDTVDLNYKFPFTVDNNDDDPNNDVSEGSTGMVDVINLAFRITAMQYLGLSNYPLGLDEWGSGFDVVHRNQAVNAIKALSDQHVFDQLFIISHYAESFGALSNPEVCVLDNSNIELPKNILKYNEHVIIE